MRLGGRSVELEDVTCATYHMGASQSRDALRDPGALSEISKESKGPY